MGVPQRLVIPLLLVAAGGCVLPGKFVGADAPSGLPAQVVASWDNKVHFVMTAVLGLTIGMVVYLILALDHPLWGEVSVSPDAFQVVASSMDRALNPLTPGERRVSGVE